MGLGFRRHSLHPSRKEDRGISVTGGKRVTRDTVVHYANGSPGNCSLSPNRQIGSSAGYHKHRDKDIKLVHHKDENSVIMYSCCFKPV